MSKAKAELRADLRRLAAELSVQQRLEIDGKITARLLSHPVFQGSRRIFLYVGVRNEIHTCDLIETAVMQGKIVALPRSLPAGMMDFYRYDGQLTEGRYRIPEPVSETRMEPAADDLLVVPGVAFDRRGYRLGQGGGYYDRYLAAHRCRTVGLCREQAFLKEVPVSWNDLPVDYVITENAVYKM